MLHPPLNNILSLGQQFSTQTKHIQGQGPLLFMGCQTVCLTSSEATEKLSQWCELKILWTWASTNFPSSPSPYIWVQQVCSEASPATGFKVTIRWGPADSSSHLFTQVSKPYGRRSDDTIIDLCLMHSGTKYTYGQPCSNIMFVADSPCLAQKFKNKASFWFRSGRKFPPLTPFEITSSLPPWPWKSPGRTRQFLQGTSSRTPSRDSRKAGLCEVLLGAYTQRQSQNLPSFPKATRMQPLMKLTENNH